MRFDFIPGRSRSTGRAAARQRRSRRDCALELESLEGRLVLSQASLHQAAIAHHQAVLAERANAGATVHPRASHASATGYVSKVPAFNDLYTGPQRSDLNIKAASVRLVPRRGFIMTAEMAGPINTRPTDLANESYYVFGIDRGSPSAVAPFSNRPNVFIDETVTVSVLRGGISVGVRDLVRPDSTSTTFLPSSALKIVGNKVQVSVPRALLPIPDQGWPIASYQFTVNTADSLDFSSQQVIDSSAASFIPPDSEAPIGIPPGYKA